LIFIQGFCHPFCTALSKHCALKKYQCTLG
jgi:hypothetical protein